jgi:3-oxoacyl-[acyl-carrier protein] reductase
VFGYINMTRAFYHTMKNRDKNGVIINITGLSGIKLDANYIAGSSGNACLETFTRTAGAYSMDHGVRILSVSPGAVQTERIETLLKHKAERELGDAQLWEKYLTNLPLQRAATPEEVANLVVFLASDKAAYISGVVYHVDGGHNARGSSFA